MRIARASKARGLRAATAAALAALMPALVPPASAEQPLLSAPIDYSIYREGAVRRVERRFGAWTLSCDEIRSLGRRFCSLRGVARADDGTIIAALAVSTDDRGRPAALVTLPYGMLLGSGTMVMKPGKTRPAAHLDLRPALCDRQGCEVVWSLLPDDIRTLSLGDPLPLHFAMATGDARAHLDALAAPRIAVEGSLQTEGFADALKASMQD